MGQATYSFCLDAKKSRLWSLSLSKCARFSRKTCVRKTEIVQTSSLTARLITSTLNGFLSLVSGSLSLVNRLPPLFFGSSDEVGCVEYLTIAYYILFTPQLIMRHSSSFFIPYLLMPGLQPLLLPSSIYPGL